MTEIVKVQRPLGLTERGAPCMVYGQHHQHIAFVREANMPAAVAVALRTREKLYCDATWKPQTGWCLGAIVEDQTW